MIGYFLYYILIYLFNHKINIHIYQTDKLNSSKVLFGVLQSIMII